MGVRLTALVVIREGGRSAFDWRAREGGVALTGEPGRGEGKIFGVLLTELVSLASADRVDSADHAVAERPDAGEHPPRHPGPPGGVPAVRHHHQASQGRGEGSTGDTFPHLAD